MFGLEKFGDGICLHRIARFFAQHAIDMAALSQRAIVITGSNGKGSTARLAAAALEGAGYSAGCFTSPHLFDVRERFRLGDAMIPEPTFAAHVATVRAFSDALPPGDRMGAFEFLFLVAVLWYEQERPDVVVWEAGLGGRYDPVRALQARVSALTSIEREHTDILGATEELIAFDKIDALASGGRLVVSASVDRSMYERIASYCALAGKTPVFAADAFTVANAANTAAGTRFDLLASTGARMTDCALRLIGRHQIDNAVAALLAASAWRGAEGEDGRDLLDGMAQAGWAGRLEQVSAAPEIWIDVGHTPRGVAAATAAFLDFTPREKVLVVFGVTAGKDVANIARIVAGRFDRFILTRAHKAGADPALFTSAFAGKDVVSEPDISRAAALARSRAYAGGLTLLVLGGHFLAAEFQRAWAGRDPRELEFL